MKFLRTFALGVVASLPYVHALPSQSSVNKRAGGQCTSGDFETEQYLGGYTNAICESNWGTSYVPITSLTLWGGPQFVVGIQASYSDGSTSQIYGESSGKTPSTIDFDYSQNNGVKSLTLYGNANGNYLRHVRIENQAGTIINAGIANPVQAGYTAFPQTVGSGILYGFEGSTDGTIINGLGFLLLDSPVSSIDISNVQFTNPPSGDTDIQPTDIDEHHVYNGATVENSWSYNNSKTRTVTHTIQQGTTNTYTNTNTANAGINLSFTGLIPLPALNLGGSTTYTWTMTSTTQTTVTVTTTKTISYSASGTLPPGKGIDALFIAGNGVGSFPYTSTVTIQLANGHTYSFAESGSFYIDDLSDTITDISEDDNPNP